MCFQEGTRSGWERFGESCAFMVWLGKVYWIRFRSQFLLGSLPGSSQSHCALSSNNVWLAPSSCQDFWDFPALVLTIHWEERGSGLQDSEGKGDGLLIFFLTDTWSNDILSGLVGKQWVSGQTPRIHQLGAGQSSLHNVPTMENLYKIPTIGWSLKCMRKSDW